MPRITLKKHEYQIRDFARWIVGKIYEGDTTQTQMAGWLNVTQQAVSYKLKNNAFTFNDFVILMDKFKASDEDILYLVKGIGKR